MVSTFKEETEETQKEKKVRHAVILVMQQRQMILVSQQSKPCLVGETRESERPHLRDDIRGSPCLQTVDMCTLASTCVYTQTSLQARSRWGFGISVYVMDGNTSELIQVVCAFVI